MIQQDESRRSNRQSRKLRPLAASRDAALIQLTLVSTSYEGRSQERHRETRIAKVEGKKTAATLTLPSPLVERGKQNSTSLCLWRP